MNFADIWNTSQEDHYILFIKWILSDSSFKAIWHQNFDNFFLGHILYIKMSMLLLSYHYYVYYYQGNEGNWQWTDKSEFKFTAWHPGEPNGGNSEDCMITNWFQSRLWEDIACYNSYRFICEIPAQSC